MKKMLMISILALCISPTYAYAKSGLISFGGEEIIKLVELPDVEQYRTDLGEHVDIGYIYKSVSILFVPIWNYDGRLCGYINDEGSYLNLSEDQIKDLAASAGVALPEQSYLDSWQLYGGKLVFLLALIAGIIYFKRKLNNQSSYISAAETTIERLRGILIEGLGFVQITNNTENKSPSELYYSGHKNYLMSFISVAIVEADNLSSDEMKNIVDRYFEYIMPLRKTLFPKSANSLAYPVFFFNKSPDDKTRKALSAYKKKKITRKTNCLPVVIDAEKQIIYGPKGMYPPKKALNNCFIQASQPENTVSENA